MRHSRFKKRDINVPLREECPMKKKEEIDRRKREELPIFSSCALHHPTLENSYIRGKIRRKLIA